MFKLSRVVMLVLLLVIPTFVFLFLQFFGKNHYRIKTYYPEKIEKNVVGGFDTTFHKTPNFSFINQENSQIDFYKNSDNKLSVVSFFFSRCPGICPRMSRQLARVQERFKDYDDLKLYSISVDPEYDTVGVLQDYAKKYEVNSNKWSLLTGDKMEVYKIGFFGLKLPADTIDKTLHSERLVLIDKEKHIRGYYNGIKPEEVDRLMTEITILDYEYKQSKSSQKQ